MDEPIKASDVQKVDTERTDDEIEKARARRAVAARLAKREALKKVGADGVGSPALAENIERGLEARVRAQTQRFRAQQAAEKAVAARRREKS